MAADRLSQYFREQPPAPSFDPTFCIVGETLCQVRVWTEDEWARIVPADRPSPAVHVPGLGWVGATLRHDPN